MTAQDSMQTISDKVALQFVGEEPLQTGKIATLEDVKVIVAAFDHALSVLMYSAVVVLPKTPRRASVLAILEQRLDHFAKP